MNSKEQGLTVGELTMTIGLLIIISLAWNTFKPTKDSKTSSLILERSQTESTTIITKA